MRIVIAGAGSIGCFTGGLLAAAGHQVTLLGRPRILAEIGEHGLTCTDFSGMTQMIGSDQLILATDPTCLAEAEVVIVTVKSRATVEVAALIAAHAPVQAPVMSWQNGMENDAALRAALAGRDVRAGMVPFNVVPSGAGCFHRATSGDIVIGAGPGDLGKALNCPHLSVTESARIEAVQWGKLVVNLNNALNALSGLTILEQLSDRAWRRLMADQVAEAIRVLKSARIEVQPTTPLPVWMMPFVLRLPTALFSRIAAQMLTIDPTARTSMAYDLAEQRPTEIDSLQGEIIALGAQIGCATPICIRVAELIKRASEEGEVPPCFSPEQIRG
jgi:2-dehydropantoate 2-reductase